VDRHVVPLRPPVSSVHERKMSQVILDFAEPLLEETVDDEDFRRAISIAIMFWDLALYPEDEQEKLFGDMIRDLGEAAQNDPEVIAYLTGVGRTLLLRKKTLFPDIKRAILDYEIVDKGDSMQLLVTSTADLPSSASNT
jgi:hypothetical protein